MDLSRYDHRLPQQSFAGFYASSAHWSGAPFTLLTLDGVTSECSLLFSFPGEHSDAFKNNRVNGPELYVMAFYFSTETITSVGYGDISPNSPLVRTVCAMEMFVGLFFAVFIVSGALEKFSEPFIPSKKISRTLKRRILKSKADKKELLNRWLKARLLWVKFRDNKVVRTCRRVTRKLHILVTFTVEFFAMLLLVVYRQSHGSTESNKLIMLIIVFLLQVAQFCIHASVYTTLLFIMIAV